MSDKKLLVLGLDGATWKLLKPYAEAGYMPTLKRLLERGTHGALESTVPAMTAPSWATFSTGKHPGHHGVFDFMLPVDSLANMKVATSEDVKSKLIYELLKEHGKRSVIINLPPAYPPRLTGTDDVMITCLLTQGEQWIFPSSLKDEFPSLQHYRLTPNESLRLKERKEAYIDDLLVHLEEHMTAVKEIFEKKPWDFFFYLFSHSDWVSHLAYTELFEKQSASPRRIFEAIDRHLAWFVEHLPADAELIMVSDHGFKPYKKIFYFNRWLEQQGYLTTTSSNEQFYTPATRRAKETMKVRAKKQRLNIGTGLFRTLGKIPGGEAVGRWVYHNIVKPYLPINVSVNVGIDYAKTQVCFPKGAYITNAYINKDWVYTNGTVSRQDYPTLLTEVVEKMRGIRDEAGNVVIKKVLTREDVYPGGAPDTAPDIFFELDEYWLVGQFYSMRLFAEEEQNKHDQYGIFLGLGPDFEPGRMVDNLKMQDMTPLLLHLMGLPVPSDCDGRVPVEVLKSDSEPARRTPAVGAPSDLASTAGQYAGVSRTNQKAAIAAALGKIKL